MKTADCDHFELDARIAVPELARAHGLHCRCALHGRRLFTGALLALPAAGALAQQPQPGAERIEECKRSGFTKVVSAGQIEQAAGQQYAQMLQQAGSKKALGPADHPQVKRLRAIAERIIPHTQGCNPASASWKWEVNLIGSSDLNAFCMPGGKIAFYYGILAKLQLDDDEVAMIMGHEMAHALLEHARERMGKTMATRGVLEIGSALLGLGDLGRMAGGMGAQLLTLRFSRDDESEADALGLVLGAKAGYNPQAGVSLWKKMMSANKGAPPQWLSTHPSGKTRIKDMQDRMPRVQPMYAAAAKPAQRFAPPELKSATPASASAPVR
jgi:predicted Zn-dependent protease